MLNDVGKRIAELRKQNGWSQAELAEKLNISDKAISKWENGGMPSVDLFPKLAKIFNVSIDYLMIGDSEGETEQEAEAASEAHPTEFEESIANLSIEDMELILSDQRELYTEEELAVLEQKYKKLLEPDEEEEIDEEEDEYAEFNRLADEDEEDIRRPRRSGGDDYGCLMYFVATICPLAGIIWGAVERKTGVVVFSIMMMILCIILGAISGVLMGSMESLMNAGRYY